MGLLAQAFGENYRYYDTPEGDDCLDKLFYVSKYAAVYGVLLSSVDVTLISKPVGYGATAARYAYITIPLTGIAAGWAASICAATNIRKKDDHWNYAIGGATSGALIGAWRKSLRVGSYSALAGACLSALYKDSIMNNWVFMGTNASPPMWNDLWSVKNDFTITDDPPKTWTT